MRINQKMTFALGAAMLAGSSMASAAIRFDVSAAPSMSALGPNAPVLEAKNGADDAPGHIRHGRGADDAAGDDHGGARSESDDRSGDDNGGKRGGNDEGSRGHGGDRGGHDGGHGGGDHDGGRHGSLDPVRIQLEARNGADDAGKGHGGQQGGKGRGGQDDGRGHA